MEKAAFLVAALALIFSVGTFYWLNVLPGKVITHASASFASAGGSKLLIELPLVLHNTGPTSISVLDLRVFFDGDDWKDPFVWQAFDSRLPGSTQPQDRHFAHALVIPPRDAIKWVFEFQKPDSTSLTGTNSVTHEFKVEIRTEGERLSKSDQWREATKISLNNVIWGGQLITRRSTLND